jgi:endonuclease/exonuclease/phosphatase family metal-dependent hydrolase
MTPVKWRLAAVRDMSRAMRLATFNLESLDDSPKARADFAARTSVLRPALERLDADVLCLQEVNAQHVAGAHERRLAALDRLLAGTRYQDYHRAATGGHGGRALADVHNLVTLSRFPIVAQRQLLHERVAPPLHRGIGAAPGSAPVPIEFDRPLLLTEIELPGAGTLAVVNVHLRAPLASPVAGQKRGPFAWRTVGGWAEGFYISTLKRAAQALELRLLVEELMARDPTALIAVAGDFNAEDFDATLRLAVAAEEDLGTSELAARSLVVLDRALPADRHWSVLHHARAQMLDHILASRSLYGHFRHIEVHNEGLGDEAVGYAKGLSSAASYHAPVVAGFDFGSGVRPGA